MSSGHWLKKQREALGLTQDQFAERLAVGGLKVSKAAISKWEMGKSYPPLQTPQTRRILADALNLKVSELLAMAGYEIFGDWSRETLIVAALFETLPPDDREMVFIIISHLKRKLELNADMAHEPGMVAPIS